MDSSRGSKSRSFVCLAQDIELESRYRRLRFRLGGACSRTVSAFTWRRQRRQAQSPPDVSGAWPLTRINRTGGRHTWTAVIMIDTEFKPGHLVAVSASTCSSSEDWKRLGLLFRVVAGLADHEVRISKVGSAYICKICRRQPQAGPGPDDSLGRVSLHRIGPRSDLEPPTRSPPQTWGSWASLGNEPWRVANLKESLPEPISCPFLASY